MYLQISYWFEMIYCNNIWSVTLQLPMFPCPYVLLSLAFMETNIIVYNLQVSTCIQISSLYTEHENSSEFNISFAKKIIKIFIKFVLFFISMCVCVCLKAKMQYKLSTVNYCRIKILPARVYIYICVCVCVCVCLCKLL